jgi:hypothetical protein
MAKICLPKELTQAFRQALKSGKINPDQLSNMTSAQRNEFFKGVVGEDFATMTNSLFESKLLLKNQKVGLINWARTVADLKPEVRRDLLARVERLQNVLTPENTDAFLNDFVNAKLGVNVTDVEAETISRLAKEATSAKEAMENGPRRQIDGLPTKEELEYGLKTIDLNNYVNDLKVKAERISMKDLISNPKKAIIESASITKSLKSSIDNSALLRQGLKTLFSNPREWFRNAPKTFSDIKKVFQGQDAQRLLNAEIISDPMYPMMQKAKLAVGSIEEAFPSRAPAEIPVLGTFFKASDAAYSGFLHRMRADLFKKYVKIAEANGVNINSTQEIQGIAKMVNSLTGRGNLGFAERGANVFNVIFFSPRNLKSNIDFLTAHIGDDTVSPFVKKQAALNLLKTVAGITTVLATAKTLYPDTVEKDARSSDFGKIRVGNTRFDVAGGMAGFATLGARLLTNSSKSSTSGKVRELGEGYKPDTRYSITRDFFENKFSPIFSEIKQRSSEETFDGEDPTITKSLINLLAPLSISNAWETKEEKDRANLLLIIISDALGIGTNTY